MITNKVTEVIAVQTVTAAIMVKHDKVFIAQREPGDRLAFKWEFPGGKLEEGETPEECLQREMKEEFGIDVSVGKFFAESIYTYKHLTIRLLAFITEWKSGELRPTDHRDYRWVPIEELTSYELAPADVPLAEKLSGNKLGLVTGS